MPTYAYRCPSCGHEFHKFHKMTVKTTPKCPECGKRTERVITGGAGLVFKGSGFYITDYKKAGAEQGEAKEKGAAKDGGAEKKPEKKPADKKKPGADH